MVVASSGRAEWAGLWIDYVLLPDRLDEQLSALETGAATSPSHAELVNMFLEQAVSNYRLARKEPDAAAAPVKPSSGKTAAVLCERAVRVAVAAKLSLEGIESVVSRQVQSLLLKALIKYDKGRHLVHECNFHRWVIRCALAAGPSVGAGRASSVEDASGILHEGSSTGAENAGSQDEVSISFLEKALDTLGHGEGKKKLPNGQLSCGDNYLSQVLFDLAEAHFMKGRIKRAHELFSWCWSLVAGLPGSCPVAQDRLNGFITACRGFSQSDAVLDSKVVSATRAVGQEAVIACEERRACMKRKRESLPDGCNGFANKHVKANGVCSRTQEQINHVKSDEGATEKLLLDGFKQEGGASEKLLEGLKEEQVKQQQVTPVKQVKDEPVLNGFPSIEDKSLVELVAGDLLQRQLFMGYCLSLAGDVSLTLAARCKLAACNTLRRVLEGASFDSAVQELEGYDEKDTILFLLRQIGKLAGQVDVERLHVLRQFSTYLCCKVEEPWCWASAAESGILSWEDATKMQELSKNRLAEARDITEATVVPGEAGRGQVLLEVLLHANSAASLEGYVPGQSGDTVVRLLRIRAFDAFENNACSLAEELLDLAKRLYPQDVDTDLFVWLVGKSGRKEHSLARNVLSSYPSCGILEYAVVKLINAEDWSSLRELSDWGSFLNEVERLGFVVKVAAVFSNLMPISVKFQETKVDDEASRLRMDILQVFEDLASLIVSARGKGQAVKTLPVFPRISGTRTLETLASMSAGWLYRSGGYGDTGPVELSRYGSLAEVISAAAQSNSLNSKFSTECGKTLFSLLTERLLETAEGAQSASKCFVSLADLAFTEGNYLKALQLYLQAGAVRSSFYCERWSSMAREFFTPWVISRMIIACKEVGAPIQAAVLCQCLPQPDYESAFQVLRENPLIVDRDASSYFECIWEIPILEFLVHLHAKSGDRIRVNKLITLLQQPALNIHNPASIRRAHIVTMEQRFLQRLYSEVV